MAVKLPPLPAPTTSSSGAIYIGIDAGSDLEQAGQNLPYWAKTGQGGWVGQAKRRGVPKYKVGYLNSKDFKRELGNLDPNVVYAYQQGFYNAGILDEFQPGKMDKATRAAFRDLLATANQSGSTWQSAFEDMLSTGVVGADKGRERDPFVAQLDDPITLRETFQNVAQNLYGGDLPDEEIAQLVETFRAQQLSKQQAAYDMQETGGTIDTEVNPQAYVQSEIKARHPDQVRRVKFQDSLATVMKTFSAGAPG